MNNNVKTNQRIYGGNLNRNEFKYAEPDLIKAWSEGRNIFIELTDKRIIGFHADRFKLLKDTSEEQLKEVEIRLSGYALRWKSIGEDITVPGILAGNFQLT